MKAVMHVVKYRILLEIIKHIMITLYCFLTSTRHYFDVKLNFWKK